MDEGWQLEPARDDPESKRVSLYFAEVIRGLLRAIAANDASGAITDVSQLMRQLSEVINKAPEGLTWYQVIEDAVNVFKGDPYEYPHPYEYQELARRSAKYLAEIISKDSFSNARIRKAEDAIEAEIRHLGQARQEKVHRFE